MTSVISSNVFPVTIVDRPRRPCCKAESHADDAVEQA